MADEDKPVDVADDSVETNQPGSASELDHSAADVADDKSDESPKEHKTKVDKDDAKKTDKTPPAKGFKAKMQRFGHAYWAKKIWTIPLTILGLLALLILIPTTRYAIAGLFVEKNYPLTVLDSQTNQPVSAASVTLGGKQATTDKDGKATVNGVKPGPQALHISKQHYTTLDQNVTIDVLKQPANTTYKLQATGRPVPIVVTDQISGVPVADADVKVLDTEGKTDASGKVTIVLPADQTKLDATITANAYNQAKVSITVTANVDPANSFVMTPAGQIYFLSKLSGTIDVVKTNLDGTNRQTVLKGTGKEDDNDTALLASRDWKYLLLKAKRDSDLAKLYLIDTGSSKVTTIDEGDANFNLIGWINHSFAYSVDRNSVQNWQPKKTALKTYNADNAQLSTLYETGATGDQNNYAYEHIDWNYQQGNNLIVYSSWSANQTYTNNFTLLSGKQALVMSLSPDGKTKSTLKAYDLPTTSSYYTTYFNPQPSYQSVVYYPNEIYYSLNGVSATSFSSVENGKVTDNDADAKTFFSGDQIYPTYLLSPGGTQTFWSESRDGKNTLFIGDSNGQNGKQLAQLSDYNPYGWYTDSYVLVSKNNSELYIMSSNSSSPHTTPLKITDYHKPVRNYPGYGGGYGGI